MTRKKKIKYTGQNCSTTNESQEELNLKNKVELNLQNHSLTHQLSNIQKEETYITPTIING
jgi:hypothetical protein